MSEHSTPIQERADILIAGGGMVGLALALGAARAGLSVAVVERFAQDAQLDPVFDGRVSAIALGSQRLIAHLGAWDAMLPHAEPILDIRVAEQHSPMFLHYDHREVGAEPFGWILENRHIRAAFMHAAGRMDNIRIIAPAEVSDFTADAAGVDVRLSDGRAIRASLLVGADGKESRVRAQAGIGVIAAPYDQTAIVCTIRHEHSHEGLALEKFLPAGPFAVLPMQKSRSSLVWVEKREVASHFLRLPDAEIIQEIRERVGGRLGNISLEGPRFSYPLSFALAKEYVAPRVALIGDAAHAIHPLAGQGVNLGFRDVAVLTELFAERARFGLDIGSGDVLAHYQRWRRFDNLSMLTVTDALTRIFSNSVPPLKAARNMGLWAVGQMPPLKRFFMRHAMGLTGDVPALMKDKAA